MIHWALIGYGGMGGWHVRKLQTMPEEFHICGVYDIDPVRNALARERGLRAYDTLEELLEDKEIQLVTIAVPNDAHLPLAEACMCAGKHVISEKPVTPTLEELYRAIAVSRETGRIFTVHQNRRWDEDFLSAKKIFDEKMLGRVFNIESRVHGSRGIPSDWRNWGVHLIDQILKLVPQDVISVFCTVTNVTNEEVDDGFSSVLTFADGLTARVEVGTSNFINLPRWYIQGQNGTAVIEDFKMNGEIVKVSDWENRDAVPVVTAAGLTKTMAPRTEETIQHYPLPRVESDVRDYYRNIADAINGEASQIVTHKEMLRVMRVIEAMLWSSKNNEVFHGRI